MKFPVPAPKIFTYGTASDPPLPSHESSAERVTPKGNPTTHKNPPNTVLNVPSDPDSYPSLLDTSSLDSNDSLENEYYKQRKLAKNNKKKGQSKTCFHDHIKKCANLKVH